MPSGAVEAEQVATIARSAYQSVYGQGRAWRDAPCLGRRPAVRELPISHLDSSAVAGEKHLLFVWRPTGYELAERDGEAPAQGAEIDLGDDGGRFVVVKVGPSPLPADQRPCAYLQPET